jgi:pimeloyl-ACP methyl ester carboxylesterase
VVLVAPAVPRAGDAALDVSWLPTVLPLALPVLPWLEGLRRHAAPPEEQVRRLLALCVASPRHGSPAAIAEMVDVARRRGRLDHARAWGGSARSLFTWLCRRGAFHRLADRVTTPVLVVEGGSDPIVPAASISALRRRHPTWQHVAMSGVGHVPQLEEPDGLAAHLEAFTRPSTSGSTRSAADRSGRGPRPLAPGVDVTCDRRRRDQVR